MLKINSKCNEFIIAISIEFRKYRRKYAIKTLIKAFKLS